MSYVHEFGIKKNLVFDPEKARQGSYDSSLSLMKLREYLLEHEISSRINGNSLEGEINGNRFNMRFNPIHNGRSMSGTAYLITNLNSNEQKDVIDLGKKLKQFEGYFS